VGSDVPLDGLGGLALVEHQVVERNDTPLILFKLVFHESGLPLEVSMMVDVRRQARMIASRSAQQDQ
jgi:hypothetical protein